MSRARSPSPPPQAGKPRDHRELQTTPDPGTQAAPNPGRTVRRSPCRTRATPAPSASRGTGFRCAQPTGVRVAFSLATSPMHPMDSGPTVVVIGGGFSGTLTAAHLLRGARAGALRVVLVERGGSWGRGVAYGTSSDAHLLNVPAGQMSAFADDPDDFLRFARRHDPSVPPGAFLPRRLYGAYLEHVLRQAEASAPEGVTLCLRRGEAVDVEAVPGITRARVTLDTGERIHGDRVVLAGGNAAPADPAGSYPALRESPRYVSDPWAPGALDGIGPDDEVLLIGTGLTMVDVVVELRARGVAAPMTAVSRRGLLPQPHRVPGGPAAPCLVPGIEEGPATARAYLRSVRSRVEEVADQGGDWRDVIAALRPRTPLLWDALPPRERARFLRHVRPYWESHRHRAAPEPFAVVRDLVERGRLRIRTGRLANLSAGSGGVAAGVRLRGTGRTEPIRAAHAINCTGPQCDVRRVGTPLVAALLRRGLARPDPLHLGWDTAPDLALRGAGGEPSRVLYYVGPLLRAAYWESTAVPELRVHAARLAASLSESLEGAASHPASVDARVQSDGPHRLPDRSRPLDPLPVAP